MQQLKRASLLGLPPELRLSIYDCVLGFDTSSLTVCDSTRPPEHEWHFSYEATWTTGVGFGTRIVRRDAHLPRISWLSLQRTCSTIRAEMQSHMRSQRSPDRSNDQEGKTNPALDPDHTYEMRITFRTGNLSHLVWTSLPCPPHECRALTAHITLPANVTFWGDGGPRPVLRQLYQTLNRFLHCGPVLGATKPLAQSLRLEQLNVVVQMEKKPGEEEGWVWRNSDDAKRELYRYVRMLAATGILGGFVRKITVIVDDRDGEAWRVTDGVLVEGPEEPARLPEEWHRYGFKWGFAEDPGKVDSQRE